MHKSVVSHFVAITAIIFIIGLVSYSRLEYKKYYTFVSSKYPTADIRMNLSLDSSALFLINNEEVRLRTVNGELCDDYQFNTRIQAVEKHIGDAFNFGSNLKINLTVPYESDKRFMHTSFNELNAQELTLLLNYIKVSFDLYNEDYATYHQKAALARQIQEVIGGSNMCVSVNFSSDLGMISQMVVTKGEYAINQVSV